MPYYWPIEDVLRGTMAILQVLSGRERGLAGFAVRRVLPCEGRPMDDSRIMLLGGEWFLTPRHLFWNLVTSSRERAKRAKERWMRQEFPPLPDETEFIPLPS